MEKTIEQQENAVREKFITMFNSNFKSIIPVEYLFSHYDLDCITNNNIHKYIELKERGEAYNLTEYYYRAIIEEEKIEFFKKVWQNSPEIQCLYFNFFYDGFICYNITNRIIEKENNHSSVALNTYTRKNMPDRTINGISYINKNVCDLRASKERFGDFARVYYSKDLELFN